MKLEYIALQIASVDLMQRGKLFGTQRGKARINHPATMRLSLATTSPVDIRERFI